MTAKKATVQGIVQGVGFRPHVYCLATDLGLSGFVQNTSSGVCVHLEGPEAALVEFFRSLESSPPPLARITSITVSEAEDLRRKDFTIEQSSADRTPDTLVSPDAASCPDCLAEMADPADRRFAYPFINCTFCGPRFTITKKLPYDRPSTVMDAFPLCPACRAEYENPRDRRFHAQPVACPDCGPRVWLADKTGAELQDENSISRAASLLRDGKILAIKGLGGFHLSADATSERAVAALRQRKNRPEKPLAVMAKDMDQVLALAHASREEQGLLLSRARPIVLLEKKASSPLASGVSPGLDVAGLLLPYTPLHHLLLERTRVPLVMTSGNRAGEPLCRGNREALEKLAGMADYFLLHDRDIHARCDDSVLMMSASHPISVRRSRGYVPSPMPLAHKGKSILAVGAHLKNTFCLVKKGQAFLSQHIGNLDSPAGLAAFEEAVEHLCSLYAIEPEIIVHDLHPDYLSTRYALGLPGKKTVGVQHHLAHVLSCLAENRHRGPVLGLSFDGVGLGDDLAAWGGECLVARTGSPEFIRAAHLGYVPLPGGDKAAAEPWRMALSHLKNAYGPDFDQKGLPFLEEVPPDKRSFVARMIEKEVNCPATSSMGRLFDAVAAICGIRLLASYEGQAAMELEALAARGDFPPYPLAWEPGPEVPPGPMIRAVAEDILSATPVPVVAARFHATLVDLFTRVCVAAGKEHGVKTAALSGGVFQNRRFLSAMALSLEGAGFSVLTHGRVPPNDGGLCLGQAAAVMQS